MREEGPVTVRSSRTIITVGSILIVIFVILIIVFAVTGSGSSSDVGPTIEPPPQCFNVVCPPAEKGDKGDPGRDGTNGMCLANPLCEKGDPGNDGKDGSDAVCQTCPRGFPGKDGEDGVCIKNCTDGAPGVCEQPCVNGTKGDKGDNGICDCFNITAIEFDEVTINEALTLNGTFECTPGTTIDPSCLIVGSCPDFSPCDLQAKSLVLSGGTPTRLQVGSFGGLSTDEVQFGDPTLPDPTDDIVSFIHGNANSIFLRSSYGFTLQSGAQASSIFDIVAAGAGSILQLRSGNDVLISAQRMIDAVADTRHRVQVLTSSTTTTPISHTVVSSNIFLISNGLEFQKNPGIGLGGPNWFDMNTLQTLDCSVVPAVPLLGTPAMHFYEDIIHGPESRIITSKMDGFQVIGPNIEVCAGSIKSSTGTLSIESTISNTVTGESVCIDDPEGLDLKDTFVFSSTTNQTDIRSTITNNDSGQAVCIDDQEGLDLKDTHLFSSTTNNITVQSDNTLVVNTILGPGSININGVIIDEDGTITAPNSINTPAPINGVGGTCCTSDLRMKQSIVPMNGTTSLDRIMKLKPIEYRWKQEILRQDHWMKDNVVRGFGAQDVDLLIPGAVHKKEKKVGDIVYKDFHTLDKTEMIPDLIAAVQELYRQNIELRMELNKIK